MHKIGFNATQYLAVCIKRASRPNQTDFRADNPNMFVQRQKPIF